MIMYEKIIASAIIMFGASALVFARRYNNTDEEAGTGVAGWTIFIIILIWCN